EAGPSSAGSGVRVGGEPGRSSTGTGSSRSAAMTSKDRSPERPGPQPQEGGVSIRWDDSTMRSIYANVCHVTGTREEVVLPFGVNQTWNSAQREVVVQLLDRVILSPFAAKRLNL